MLALASEVAAAEGNQPLPLTHATVARNFAPIGPVMRVVASEGAEADDMQAGITIRRIAMAPLDAAAADSSQGTPPLPVSGEADEPR